MQMLKAGTLEQILEVLQDFKSNYAGGDSVRGAYQQACRTISRRYDVAYQTIADACRRRLGLTDIGQFRELLRKWVEGDAKELVELLKRNTSPSLHHKITVFFEGHPYDKEAGLPESGISAKEPQSEIISFRISNDIAKQLKVLAEMKGQSVGDLLGERVTKFVSEEIVEEFAAYINGLGRDEADRVRKMLLRKIESKSQNEL
jgi:hypothetical protein